MPDEIPMVTSCPLCLAPDEVQSMVTVQIDRAIPKGRAAVMICRNCTVAVIEAAAQLEPPLLSTLLADTTPPIEAPAASEPSEPEQTPDVAPEGIDYTARSESLNEATRQIAHEYLEGVGEKVELTGAKEVKAHG